MKRIVGEILVKKIQQWRSLEFIGIQISERWFVGFVSFNHRTDPRR